MEDDHSNIRSIGSPAIEQFDRVGGKPRHVRPQFAIHHAAPEWIGRRGARAAGGLRLPNPPELVFRLEPEPASEASVTTILPSPHRKLKRPLESVYPTVLEIPLHTLWIVTFWGNAEPSSMTTLPEI
jgi:hypothetical protein